MKSSHRFLYRANIQLLKDKMRKAASPVENSLDAAPYVFLTSDSYENHFKSYVSLYVVDHKESSSAFRFFIKPFSYSPKSKRIKKKFCSCNDLYKVSTIRSSRLNFCTHRRYVTWLCFADGSRLCLFVWYKLITF